MTSGRLLPIAYAYGRGDVEESSGSRGRLRANGPIIDEQGNEITVKLLVMCYGMPEYTEVDSIEEAKGLANVMIDYGSAAPVAILVGDDVVLFDLPRGWATPTDEETRLAQELLAQCRD